MPKLYIQMDDEDKKLMEYAKTITGGKTYHDALVNMIDGDNFSAICWLSMMSTELRKIAINLRQLSKLDSALDSLAFLAGETITAIENYTNPLFCMYLSIGIQKEVQVPMTRDEKDLFKNAKKATKARSYRSLLHLLVKSLVLRKISIPLDELYPVLHSIGVEINGIAKEFNKSGYASIDWKVINSLSVLLGQIFEEINHVAKSQNE